MNVIAPEPFPTLKTRSGRAEVEKPQPEEKAEAPKDKLSGKFYEKALLKLQTELCYLQDWVRETGARVVIVLRGPRHGRQGWPDQADDRAGQSRAPSASSR